MAEVVDGELEPLASIVGDALGRADLVELVAPLLERVGDVARRRSRRRGRRPTTGRSPRRRTPSWTRRPVPRRSADRGRERARRRRPRTRRAGAGSRSAPYAPPSGRRTAGPAGPAVRCESVRSLGGDVREVLDVRDPSPGCRSSPGSRRTSRPSSCRRRRPRILVVLRVLRCRRSRRPSTASMKTSKPLRASSEMSSGVPISSRFATASLKSSTLVLGRPSASVANGPRRRSPNGLAEVVLGRVGREHPPQAVRENGEEHSGAGSCGGTLDPGHEDSFRR